MNISAPSLGDLDLPDRIVHALNERDLSADLLTVEITEDLLVDNIDRARTVLNKLRAHGIRVAIDDFGGGYSALSYLRDLPIDEVKLDRQFVAPILNDVRSAAIVRAVIDLAHDLGVTTVAEGVEDDETADRLPEYGCEIVQGFYCSPPVGAGAILDMLRGEKPCCGEDTAPRCGSRDRVALPLERNGLCRRYQPQRDRVDAVALIGRRRVTLALEDVAQVAVAVGAYHLDPMHASRVVGPQDHRVGVGRIKERRPAAMGFVLSLLRNNSAPQARHS